MRKLLPAILAIILILTAAFSVSAATGASAVGCYATVSSDESCQLTLSVTLHIESVMEELDFPVPVQATNVTVNGSRVRTSKSDSVRIIDLTNVIGHMIGDFSISVNYTLPDVVQQTENGGLELQLPLLSGFSYPVSSMEFSVTLPGQITGEPAFSSGYHQSDIEKDMHFTVSGTTVSGSFRSALKDHETLTMTLDVTEEMFPQPAVQLQSTELGVTAMGICAALALLYWLIFLRTAPPARQYSAEPPQGCTAGELGSILCMRGADLTMMVLSWAQMGYILVQADRSGRVLLHKRMDMGNERGELEQRCFRKLFGKRQLVDTSGYHYAELCRVMEKQLSGLRDRIHPNSGNPRVFRVLVSGIGLFSGVCLGLSLGSGAVLQGFWVFLLAVAGAVCSWFIQEWGRYLFLRHGGYLWACLGLCAGWVLLSLAAGQLSIGLWTGAALLLGGLLLAFGGRRTELGKQSMSQVLGLRRYLRTVPRAELQRICSANPEYFHSIAPYALALGVQKAFARRFGSLRLPGCPYLTTGMDAHMTAEQWCQKMTQVAAAMDERHRKMPVEKLLQLLSSLRK